MIFVVPIISRDALIILKSIERNIRIKNLSVKSLYLDPDMKNYIFLEADDENVLKSAIAGVNGIKARERKIRTILDVELQQLLMKLTIKPTEEFNIGDIVEIVKGPFAGEKAKIVNKTKDGYTVLPLELSVVVPVSVDTKAIRLLKSSKK